VGSVDFLSAKKDEGKGHIEGESEIEGERGVWKRERKRRERARERVGECRFPFLIIDCEKGKLLVPRGGGAEGERRRGKSLREGRKN
jgi:hypothetical protein